LNKTYFYKYNNERIYDLIENKYIYWVFPVLIDGDFTCLDEKGFENSISRISRMGNQIELFDFFKQVDEYTFYLFYKKIIDYYLKYNDFELENTLREMYNVAKKNKYSFLTEATNFLLKNINHTRTPFENTNYKAKSIEEYNATKRKVDSLLEKFKQDKLPLINKINVANNEINKLNIQLEELLHLKKDAEQLLKKLTINKRRIDELEEIASLSPIERIKAMANSEKSIAYFPDYFLLDVLKNIKLLTLEEKALLIKKLDSVNKPIYKKLKNSILG
jgi:hypothetical protein